MVAWRAPIGYLNVNCTDGANIILDEERAPLIRRAFELMATGLHKKTSVLKIITDEGLITHRGKPLSSQTMQAVLRNPLYAGWITLPSDESFKPIRGLHEPITTQETFDRVQAILDGRRPNVAPARKLNPAFPLTCFVHCETCGTPLTGAFCKGRSKLYPRYWCPNRNCKAVKLSKEQLESEFIALLRRLRLKKNVVSSFPKIAAKAWADRQEATAKETRRLATHLENQKRLKRNLLRAYLDRSIAKADYDEANAEFGAEISVTEMELQAIDSKRGNQDAFIRFAELHLIDIAGAWQIAGDEQRRRVQSLLFNGGLQYSKERGILNHSNSSLFSMLAMTNDGNELLASPTGFEPVLPP